jgi:hypothetical protein
MKNHFLTYINLTRKQILIDIICSVSLCRKLFSGVLCDIPAVGVAKNLYQMDGILHHDDDHKCMMLLLREPGDYFALKKISGNVLGLVSLFDDGMFQIRTNTQIFLYY